MSFKRFIKKSGRLYGPYVYESYRDEEGIVRKRYIGKAEEKKSAKLLLFLIAGLLISLTVLEIYTTTFYGRDSSFFINVYVAYSGFMMSEINFLSLYAGKALDFISLLIQPRFTGRANLDIQESYSSGDYLSGNLQLKVKYGELIPGAGKMVIEQGGKISEFNFSDIVKLNANGNFYVEDRNISGSGEGYGFEGQREVYPKVFFTLVLGQVSGSGTQQESQPETPAEENQTQVNEIPLAPEQTENTSQETQTQAQSEQQATQELAAQIQDSTKQQAKEQKAEEKAITTEEKQAEKSKESIQPGITGAAVSETNEIEGSVSKNSSFSYSVGNQPVSVKENSVYSDYENLSAGVLNLRTENGELAVSTEYSKTESGFGENYIESKESVLQIPLDKLRVLALNGTINVKLVYDGVVLAEISKEVSVSGEILNVTNETFEISNFSIIKNLPDIQIEKNRNYTINLNNYFSGAEGYDVGSVQNIILFISGSTLEILPQENFTGKRNTTILAYSVNSSLSQDLNIEVAEPSGILIKTRQYKAVVGKPVRWLKTINIKNETELEGLTIELPKTAENITIKQGDEARSAVSESENYDESVSNVDRGSLIAGNVALDINNEAKPGILTRLFRFFRFTGRVIEENVSVGVTETEDRKIVNLTEIVNETGDIAIEYYTQPSEVNETPISGGKFVQVYAPDELNYTDILAYTLLDAPGLERVPMGSGGLKVYWHAGYDDAVRYGYVNESLNQSAVESEISESGSEKSSQEAIKNETGNLTEVGNETASPVNESSQTAETEESNFSGSLITGSVSLETEQPILNEPGNENQTLGSFLNETHVILDIEIPFDSYDLNNDSYVDYIEWIVPHLSTQNYSIIFSSQNMSLSNITIDNGYSHLTVSSSSPYNSLVGYWSFDADNSSTAFDFSGNNYDGIYNSTAISNSTGCIFGTCLGLNGTSTSCVYIPNTLSDYKFILNSSNPALSISLWFKANSVNPVYYTLAGRDGYSSRHYYVINLYNTRLYTVIRGDNSTGLSPQVTSDNSFYPAAGVWHHYVVTINITGNLTTYNNTGKHYTTFLNWTAINWTGTDFEIGGSPATFGGRSFNGMIDEFMVFNKELTQTEINDIYKNQSSRFINPGLQTIQQFNITSGNDKISVSLDNYKRIQGSNISLRLGVWNSSFGYNNSDLNGNSGLISYYHFDEASWSGTSGEVKDAMGLNNGTSYGNASTNLTNYPYGKVGSFDGVNSYVDAGQAGNFTGKNLTISAWVYLRALTENYIGNMRYLGTSGYAFAPYAGRLYLANGSAVMNCDTTNPSTNSWSHYVFVVNMDDKIYAYKDGVNTLNCSLTITGNIGYATYNLIIGRDAAGASYFYNGSMDELMIFNRTLSASEIQELYIRGRALWNYTNWQNLSGNGSDTHSTNVYSINNTATNVLPELMLLAGNSSNPFYTPLVIANVSLPMLITSFSSYPSITMNSPVNNSNLNVNQVSVNLSAEHLLANVSAFVDFDNSLLLWMRMDDVNSSGDPTDLSSYSNNGSKQGNAQQTDAGYFGKGFSLDGANSYISASTVSGVNTSRNVTFSLWVKTNNSNQAASHILHHVVTSYDGLAIGYSGGIITVGDANGTGSAKSGSIAANNGWYHIVFVHYSNETNLLYINNIVQIGITNPPSGTTAGFKIGFDGVSAFFNGTIDEVLIFNRSLSDSEVAALYANATSKYLVSNISATDGAHTIKAYAQSTDATYNQTDKRDLFLDTVYPTISFVSPTLANNSYNETNAVYINLTTSDSNTHYAFVDFDSSLVGWWRMDDVNSSGDPTDLSSYSNNGSKQGNAQQTDAGRFGKGFLFDGDGDYVSLGSGSSLNITGTALTVSAWVNPKTIRTGGYDMVTGQGGTVTGGWMLSSDFNAWEMAIFNGTANLAARYTTVVPVTNTWTFLTGVVNSTTIALFVNGQLVQTKALVGQIGGGFANEAKIGRDSATTARDFNGTIDEVLIFNRSLTQQEISSLYNASASKYYNNFTNLARGWHTAKAYAVDIGGNKNQTQRSVRTSSKLVNSCGNLYDSNIDYVLNKSVNYSSDAVCISFLSSLQNTTFDCEGKYIRETSKGLGSYAFVFYSGCKSITIKNCNLFGFQFGISNAYDTNLTAYNNTIEGQQSIGGGYGIFDVPGSTGGNISFNRISNFSRGIYSDAGFISDNYISNFSDWGIYGSGSGNYFANNVIENGTMVYSSCFSIYSTDVVLINNTVKFCYYGFLLSYYGNKTLANSTSFNNSYGIFFNSVKNVTLAGNNFTNNSVEDFYISPDSSCASNPQCYNHTIAADNYVSAGRLYYNLSISNYVYDSGSASGAGMVYCAFCNNITVKNLNISRGRTAVLLHRTTNSTINNLSLNSGRVGIYLYNSTFIYLGNSTLNSNNYGIYVAYGENNTLTGNTVLNSVNQSIVLLVSSNNTVLSSNITNGSSLINILEGKNNLFRGVSLLSSTSLDVNTSRISGTQTCNNVSTGLANCSQLTDSSVCTSSVAGCNLFTCTGDILNQECDQLTSYARSNGASYCDSYTNYNCSWNYPYCGGNMSSCSEINYDPPCTSVQGCNWGVCSGTWDCGNISDSYFCQNYASGCSWGRCTGSVNCTSITGYSVCSQANCYWNGDNCSSTGSESCSGVSESFCSGSYAPDCSYQYECYGAPSNPDCGQWNSSSSNCDYPSTCDYNSGFDACWGDPSGGDGCGDIGESYCSGSYTDVCSWVSGNCTNYTAEGVSSCYAITHDTSCGYVSGCSQNDLCNGTLVGGCSNISSESSCNSYTSGVCSYNWSEYYRNTFLNVSYNSSRENVSYFSELLRKWYYRAYVNDTSGGALTGITVTATNRTGAQEFNELTDATGYTALGELTEYLNQNGTRAYSGNYTASAGNSSYFTGSHSYNATSSSYKDVLTLSYSENITGCGILDTPNTIYTQRVNIVPTSGTVCINITAQNITFDCRGKWISNETLEGIGIYSNQKNTTIKNCNVTMGFGYGIHLEGANNSYILNTSLINQVYGLYLSSTYFAKVENITANSNTNGKGIWLSSSSNNNLTNIIANSNTNGIYLDSSSNNNILTNITANSNTNGIYLDSSSNNTLLNITANLNDYVGIYLDSSSNNNLTNIIANSNTDGKGIWLYSSSNNNLTNIIANSNTDGIRLYSSSNNNLTNIITSLNTNYGISLSYSLDNIFTDGNISSNIVYDAYLVSTSTNNVFLNVTYNISKEYIESGSELIRKWYYRAYVNDTSRNNVPGANITAYNVSGAYNFNLTTNSSGYSQLGGIIDYINNGTTTYSSNYTIYASNSSYQTKSVSYNVTSNENNLNHNIMLVPFSNVTTCENLTTANQVYTLGTNISTTGTCFTILADNITLNGNGQIIHYAAAGTHYGIYALNVRNATIMNFKNITNFTYQIYFLNTNNSLIKNNTITGSAKYGIYLENSSNNQIANSTINMTGNNVDITLGASSTNNIVRDTRCLSTYYVWLYSNSINNTFLNTTFSSDSVASGSQLIRKWYYRAQVNDTNGTYPASVSNANVTAYNRTGNYNFNLTTDSTGYTALTEIIGYINNAGTTTYSSNYTIYAGNSSYFTRSHSYNATSSNYGDNFTLKRSALSSCGTLDEANGYYTLSQSLTAISANCLTVAADNITIDFRKFGITCSGNCGSGYYTSGVLLSTGNNTRIINTSTSGISNFYFGVNAGSVKNTYIENVNSSCTGTDMYIQNSANFSIVNVTYQSDSDSFTGSTGFVYWHYRAYANDTNGNSVVANVTAYNSSNSPIFSIMTDSTGYTNITNLPDFYYNGAAKIYYSDYNITAVNSSYPSSSNTYNSTLSKSTYSNSFTFQGLALTTCQSLPVANQVYTLTSSVYTTGTCFNITANNVTLDCGNWNNLIDYGNSTGTTTRFGVFSVYNSTTIRNCSIRGNLQNSTNKKYGVYISGLGADISSTNIVNSSTGINVSNTGSVRNTYITGSSTADSSYGFFVDSNYNLTNISATSLGYGAYITGQNNSVYNTTANLNAYGIYLSGASAQNNTINFSQTSNNTVTGTSIAGGSGVNLVDYLTSKYNGNYGISLAVSSQRITNSVANYNNWSGVYINYGYETLSNVTANSNNHHGLLFATTNYMTNTFMDIVSNSNGLCGINITASTLTRNNNLTRFSLWNNTCGIYIRSKNYFATSLNYITNGMINQSGNGLILALSNNTIFSSVNITNSIQNDTILIESWNNTFINVSYQTEVLTGNSSVWRKWYYRAFVNDTQGNNVTGANVTAYNRTGDYNFNLTTDSSGYSQLGEIVDYLNTGTKTYYYNYTIHAVNSSYYTLNHTYNSSSRNNYKDVFTLTNMYVTSCQNLTQANTVYTQGANIDYSQPSATSCINITAENITYDCSGRSITSTGDNISIYSNQKNTTIKNCKLVGAGGTLGGKGIYFDFANNSYILNTSLHSHGYSAIYMNNTYNFYFSDVNSTSNAGNFQTYSSSNGMVYNSNFSDGSGEVMLSNNSINNTFINCSYTLSKESVGSGSELIRKWYYRAYVNDTSGNGVSNANVTAYNLTGDYNFNLTTNSSGYSQLGEIVDYISNGTRTYYSLYNIYAVNSSYTTLNHTYNATSNQSNYKDVFTLSLSENVTGCRILDVPNTVYTQRTNIIPTSGTSCINITASNVTFDGAGYSIANSTFFAIGIYSNQQSTTIKNCNISLTTTGGTSIGIQLSNADNSYIYNNTITNNLRGIYLSTVNSTVFENNTINSNSIGIYMDYSNYNQFRNNNFWNCTGPSYGCIYIYNGPINYNTFTGGLINQSSNNLIEIVAGNHTLFKDIQMLNSGANDVYIWNSGSINNTFTNCSYNMSKESVGSGSQLIRKWYYRAYVNDTNGNNVNNANVTAYNRTGDYNFNLTTNSSGYSQLGEIVDYISNGTRTYYSLYNIYAVNSSYTTLNHTYNATSNQSNYKDLFTLTASDTTPPQINFTSPTPANGSSQTASSIYVNLTTSDANTHYAFVDFDNSLVFWMRMDDRNANGQAIDLVYGNNGSLVNHVVINSTPSVFGNASHFDGTDDYLTMNDTDALDIQGGQITVAAWIRTLKSATQYPVKKAIIGGSSGQADGYELSLSSTQQTFFRINQLTNANAYRINQNNTYPTDGTWFHAVGTWNGSYLALYINGTLSNATALTPTTLSKNTLNLTLGSQSPPTPGSYLNGSVDEVLIFNRTLSAAEIQSLYNASAYKYYNNFTNLAVGTHRARGYAVDATGNKNQTEERQFSVRSLNVTGVYINSTDGSNRTVQDLNCYATLSDNDGGKLNASVRWYGNNILNLSFDHNSSYNNGTVFVAVLDDGNTTKGENWSCSIRTYNGFMYSEWANSSQLRILNTLPNITLLTPANGNITTNRTPTFTWSGADDDSDSLTYEINISLVASSTCSDTNLYENNNTIGSSTSYTASRYLKCLIDNNDFYNWTVRAYDGEAFGSWAARKNVSVQSDISMSLPVNYILFGAMNMSQSINTTSGSPAPFVLRNDGNALLNISINSSALFVEGSHPSNNLQYKIRNKSGCYEDTGTQTSFTQIPATSAQALNKLNFTSGYQTGCNNVSVDVLVTVPSGEAPGNKSTIVTFISRLGEI